MNDVHSARGPARLVRLVRVLGLVAVALVALGAAAPEARATVMRYALIIGSNVGVDGSGAVKEPLTHAEAEAALVRDALRAHSGFDDRAPRTIVLTRPARGAVLAAVSRLRATIAADRRDFPGHHDVLFLLYYSGHGLDGQLLLADGPLDARELDRALGGLGADLRVNVLDACHAASLDGGRTVAKGVVPDRGFALDRVVPDDALHTDGVVWLAASSGSAFEDPERGGFFTTAFVEALTRARSDELGITLGAVWEYVRDRTRDLARQIDREQLPVRKDFTRSDGAFRFAWVPRAPATLVLGAGVGGELAVRFDDGGQFTLYKAAGERVERRVHPGHVQLLQLGEGPPKVIRSLELEPGGRGVVGGHVAAAPALSFGRTMTVVTRKGDDGDFAPAAVAAEVGVEGEATTVFLGAEMHLAAGDDRVLAPPWIVSATARVERGPWLARVGVGVGFDSGEFPSWRYDARALLGSLQLGYGVNVWRLRFSPFVELAGGQVWQSYDDGASRRARFLSLTGGLATALEVVHGVAVELSLDLGAREGRGLRQDSAYRWTAAWGAALGVSFLL